MYLKLAGTVSHVVNHFYLLVSLWVLIPPHVQPIAVGNLYPTDGEVYLFMLVILLIHLVVDPSLQC